MNIDRQREVDTLAKELLTIVKRFFQVTERPAHDRLEMILNALALATACMIAANPRTEREQAVAFFNTIVSNQIRIFDADKEAETKQTH